MTTFLRAAASCVFLFMTSCAGERIIGVGDRIHHDDFEYRVTNYVTRDSLGSASGLRKAAGLFYIVNFEVENRAKRVDHPWDNSIAYVVDEQGNKYENLADLQGVLNSVQPFNYAAQHVTHAGATEATQFVFDLPVHARRPMLQVRGDLMMGDVFDGKAFERTKVRLY